MRAQCGIGQSRAFRCLGKSVGLTYGIAVLILSLELCRLLGAHNSGHWSHWFLWLRGRNFRIPDGQTYAMALLPQTVPCLPSGSFFYWLSIYPLGTMKSSSENMFVSTGASQARSNGNLEAFELPHVPPALCWASEHTPPSPKHFLAQSNCHWQHKWASRPCGCHGILDLCEGQHCTWPLAHHTHCPSLYSAPHMRADQQSRTSIRPACNVHAGWPPHWRWCSPSNPLSPSLTRRRQPLHNDNDDKSLLLTPTRSHTLPTRRTTRSRKLVQRCSRPDDADDVIHGPGGHVAQTTDMLTVPTNEMESRLWSPVVEDSNPRPSRDHGDATGDRASSRCIPKVTRSSEGTRWGNGQDQWYDKSTRRASRLSDMPIKPSGYTVDEPKGHLVHERADAGVDGEVAGVHECRNWGENGKAGRSWWRVEQQWFKIYAPGDTTADDVVQLFHPLPDIRRYDSATVATTSSICLGGGDDRVHHLACPRLDWGGGIGVNFVKVLQRRCANLPSRIHSDRGRQCH